MSELAATDFRAHATRGSSLSRFALSVLGGLAVNLSLFALMHSLIAQRDTTEVAAGVRPVFEFLRLRHEEATETKTRRAPDRKPVRPTAQLAPLAVAKSAAPGRQAIAAPTGDLDVGFSLAGRPYLGGSVGEVGGGVGAEAGAGASEAVPLVRVSPLYPPRAQSRGVEGWVQLQFTITPQGTTKDIEVVDANPKGYFESAAKDAVRKYKYKPRIVDGVAVDWPGVQLVISFKLEK